MARDYENLHDIEDLGDRELAELISRQLGDEPDVDADDVDIRVEEGFVTLGGRVGSEHDLQVIAQVVSDVLGIRSYANEMVVDELRRPEMPEAADEDVARDEEATPQMSGHPDRTTDTADPLMEHEAEELYGTHDLHEALEQGLDYEPPDRPIQEGSRSEENH